MGQTIKLRGNPQGQRYRSGVATSCEHHVVAWYGYYYNVVPEHGYYYNVVPEHGYYNVVVTIRWLQGVTQPSGHTQRISPLHALLALCTGWSSRHPATPLSCRGDQALAAGSETRRRSV